jgi:hypothetical protein
VFREEKKIKKINYNNKNNNNIMIFKTYPSSAHVTVANVIRNDTDIFTK